MVFSNLDVLHGSHPPKDFCKVFVIETYGEKDANLPHPIPMEDYIMTLRATINTIVAWPKNDLISEACDVFKLVNLFEFVKITKKFF